MRRGHAVAATAGLLLLATFCSSTFLYNLPRGPLRDRMDAILSPMDPWLAQNWSFFAPDPPSSDMGVLVRFSRLDHQDERRSFTDLTTVGLESTKEKIVPPREYRLLTSAVDLFLSAEDSLVSFHPDAISLGSRLADRDRAVTEMLASDGTPTETKHAFIHARKLLVRAARYFYEKYALKIAGTDDAIQLRLVNYSYPRFVERSRSATEEFDLRTLPWWRAA